MSLSVTGVRVAIASGIMFCSIFTGANLTVSYVIIPTLLLPAATGQREHNEKQDDDYKQLAAKSLHLARQWQNMYNIGSRAGPVVSLGGLASFVFAARGLPHSLVLNYRLSLLAAGLCVAILPFTLLFMKRVNDELHRRADSGLKSSAQSPTGGDSTFKDCETAELLRRWSNLNLMYVDVSMWDHDTNFA